MEFWLARPTYNEDVTASQAPDLGAPYLDFPVLPDVSLRYAAPLSEYTRFGIGGPADLLVETGNPESFAVAIHWLRTRQLPHVVLGGGTNLVVADGGYAGVVLRFTDRAIRQDGHHIHCGAGAELMDLVQFSVDAGLEGIQTLMGIPGWVGAAIYGNAGAYGHSIEEVVERVDFFDGEALRSFTRAECQFRYRESIFKRNKQWTILRATLQLKPGDRDALQKIAADILATRNAKFPPTMRCAGGIFKNQLAAELLPAILAQVPTSVIREGKIPSAWFLEQIGAKGRRIGGIQVAEYHANLIYNDGDATADDLCDMIDQLKADVFARFGITLEEEVQYFGFEPPRGQRPDATNTPVA